VHVGSWSGIGIARLCIEALLVRWVEVGFSWGRTAPRTTSCLIFGATWDDRWGREHLRALLAMHPRFCPTPLPRQPFLETTPPQMAFALLVWTTLSTIPPPPHPSPIPFLVPRCRGHQRAAQRTRRAAATGHESALRVGGAAAGAAGGVHRHRAARGGVSIGVEAATGVCCGARGA